MQQIDILALDVDGVLTDGRLLYGVGDEPLRAFHVHDGLAIDGFQRVGGTVVIVTAKKSRAVAARAGDLRIRHVIQGSKDKLGDVQRLLGELRRDLSSLAMIGDDLPDLPLMRACGYAIAPANAAEEVRSAARYVTARRGGKGAVREAVEHLLRADGRWAKVLAAYEGGAQGASEVVA